MKTRSNFGESSMRGVAPIVIILVVVLIGGAAYAVVNRTVLKSFFETGDIPTEEQFADTIDSSVHKQDDGIQSGSKSYDPAKTYTTGDTVVKSNPIYQAKVLGEVQPVFKLDSTQAVTFRWTPIVPKPQEPVTYRLKVWQLMEGQNGSSAMKTNKPIVTKDVADITEATVSNIYTGPCKPPYLCDFVWSVEVVAKPSTSATGSVSTTSATDSTSAASAGTSGY